MGRCTAFIALALAVLMVQFMVRKVKFNVTSGFHLCNKKGLREAFLQDRARCRVAACPKQRPHLVLGVVHL